RGAEVVVNSRPGKDGEPATADAVVDDIRAKGGVAVASTTSVETREGAQAVIDTAIEHFGKLDILINNAGINHGAAVENITPEDLRALVGVHINGTTWATGAAVLHMRERGYGRIVMTASHNGIFARVHSTAYATVKSAILGLGHSCAIELEPDGILVNTVLP